MPLFEELIKRESMSSDYQATAALLELLRRQSRLLVILITIFCVFTSLLLFHLWSDNQQEIRLKEEIARRFQTEERVNLVVGETVTSMKNTVLSLQDKVDVLENTQSKTQSHYDSLEQMYVEFAKNHNDKILSDIEQILFTVNQQLKLTGNVHGALIALDSVDKFLSDENKSQFMGIRRALSKDIENLKSVPFIDVPGMAMKLDKISDQVKSLPLSTNLKVQHISDQVNSSNVKEESASLSSSLKILNEAFWKEVTGFVRTQNVSASDKAGLSLLQQYFLQENLVLRILGARVAMIAGDHASFMNDMRAAIKIIDTYYDSTSPCVKKVKITIEEVINNNTEVKIPEISESMIAIKQFQSFP